jgi:deoxyribodipyrimidine photolyase-related protein
MIEKKLILLLGDQLDINSPLLRDIDLATSEVIMIESRYESDYVWSHKAKIALFLSAMRHFAQKLKERNIPVTYIKKSSLKIEQVLRTQIQEKGATELICIEPGEWRLMKALEALASDLNVKLIVHEDAHFYCTINEFKFWAADKKELRMEYFYRYMREKASGSY